MQTETDEKLDNFYAFNEASLAYWLVATLSVLFVSLLPSAI
jgi:hypothetical protein